MKKTLCLLAALLLAQPTFALSPTKARIAKASLFCKWFQSMGFNCKPLRISDSGVVIIDRNGNA